MPILENADSPKSFNSPIKSYQVFKPNFRTIPLATMAIIKIQIPIMYNRIIKIV